MKKQAKSGKATKVPMTVDEYLKRLPEPSRSALQRVRAIVRTVVPPEATEVISYGIPTFKYNGMLMSFAAFSNHCSLFPGAGPIKQFKNDLKNFETAKGTIRFAPERPLPSTLLKKLVSARVAENKPKKGK
ncbi:MAG: DUF1801 domain-containing protein [Candidatus Sulfotelmatobacter sp.]